MMYLQYTISIIYFAPKVNSKNNKTIVSASELLLCRFFNITEHLWNTVDKM